MSKIEISKVYNHSIQILDSEGHVEEEVVEKTIRLWLKTWDLFNSRLSQYEPPLPEKVKNHKGDLDIYYGCELRYSRIREEQKLIMQEFCKSIKEQVQILANLWRLFDSGTVRVYHKDYSSVKNLCWITKDKIEFSKELED